jgi:hypothetical protein
MAKGGITWKYETPDGGKRQAYAERIDGRWHFYSREKRFDDWIESEHPPLAHWLEVLDGVRRRIGRQLIKRDEEAAVIRAIKQRFPDAVIPD